MKAQERESVDEGAGERDEGEFELMGVGESQKVLLKPTQVGLKPARMALSSGWLQILYLFRQNEILFYFITFFKSDFDENIQFITVKILLATKQLQVRKNQA